MSTPAGQAFMVGALCAFLGFVFACGDDIRKGAMEPVVVVPLMLVGGFVGMFLGWMLG